MQLSIEGMQRSIVRERRRAIVLYMLLTALYGASLEKEAARVYLFYLCVLLFSGLVFTPGMRA